MVYSWMVQKDKDIPGTVVRSTTIPEELGRLTFLLSDKTGTLTKNEMVIFHLFLLLCVVKNGYICTLIIYMYFNVIDKLSLS